MRHASLTVLCLSALLTSSALAADRQLVGVLDMNWEVAKLSEAEVLDLTGLVREKARDLLGDRYAIMTREELEYRLKASGEGLERCRGPACETEIGRKVGAELIVSGSVRKLFGQLNLELKLHATDAPRVLGIKIAWVRDISELPDATMRLATALLGAVPGDDEGGGAGAMDSSSVRVAKRTAIAAGDEHTCALDSQGNVACWGWNAFSQASPPKGSFVHIDAGNNSTCALDTKGRAVCWGDNHDGQSSPPRGSFTDIAVGRAHACALDTKGRAICWGNNKYGRCTPPRGSFTDIDAATWHTCALDTNGKAVCWGKKVYRESAPPSGSFSRIATHDRHHCALDAQGRAICWNREGTDPARPAPGTFTDITAGGWSTCALDSQGSAVCWGKDKAGESTPPSGSFTDIATGGSHTCALNSQGKVVCWGANWRGQSDPPPNLRAP